MADETCVNVRVPPELKRPAKAKAALQGKTLAGVVRELLEAWLEENGQS